MKWTSGFNMGLLSGLALGFLLAPEKGSETRAYVGRQVQRCTKKVRQLCRPKDADIEALKDYLRHEETALTPEMRRQLLQLIKKAEHAMAWEQAHQ
ncbi:MAG TPA: YtxH domain-containing protein [Edaphocola sp.]|nr:YtxH domain-containing protein [Edaphocola sp.]